MPKFKKNPNAGSPMYKMKGSPYQHDTGGAGKLFQNIGSGMGLQGIISNLFGGGGGGGNILQGLLGGLFGKKDKKTKD